MAIAGYLREIGRGAKGARALRRDQAQDLMGQVLDGQASDLEIGAFSIAMRMKGETLDELTGFLDALHTRLLPVSTDRPLISIASYNGARRLPNLVALLALLLARAGARVLVHGPLRDPQRVTTAEVFEALSMPPAASADAIVRAWRDRGCSFVPIAALSPALDRLLAVRRSVGLRNSGHTIAKMLQPVRGDACLRLMSHTHPEFGQLMAEYAEQERADMGLLRGTEGEAVADPRRQPRQRIWIGGRLQADLTSDAEAGTLAPLPALPAAIDAGSTARWIESALQGQTAIPEPLIRQVDLLMRAYARLPEARTAGSARPPSGAAD
jgi:anthranilate phosphoribosyltransferase